MKNLFFTSLLLLFLQNIFSQCIIDTSNTFFGLLPTSSSIPCINRNQYYSQTFELYIPPTFIADTSFPPEYVYSFRIDSITNLPCGMGYRISRSDRTYVTADLTNRGCIEILGRTNDTVGQYYMKIYITIHTNIITVSGEAALLPSVGANWDIKLRVKDPTSICNPIDTSLISKISSCPTIEYDFMDLYTLRGNVYADINNNCLLEPAIDRPLKNKMIVDQYSNHRSISNSSGSYLLYTYDTSKLFISNLYDDRIDCASNDSIFLKISASSITRDTSGIHFLLSGDNCYKNNVNIGIGQLSNCRDGVFTINYSNLGYDTSYNSFILIEVDTLVLDSFSSTIPFVQSGDTLKFDLGHIPPITYGTFNINSHVRCSTIIGTSTCARAYIFPISNCPPSSIGYDSSQLAVKTNCSNDTVHVEIKNQIDAGNMSAVGKISYFEDDSFQKIDSFMLNAGSIMNYDYYVNSDKTLTLKVEQNQNHPYRPILLIHDELCALTSPIKLNSVVNNFYRYDDSPEYDEACMRILASYDPNIKTVTPEGFTSQHHINRNQSLEYRIDFQNTGLAAAENIIVEDSISNFLDINSIIPISSSHNYSIEIKDNNIIHFVFDSIMLPDSNSNEPASHGYIIFKINPKYNLPHGTRIDNYADIFFDFNAPVRTNTVFNMIYDTVNINIGINKENINLEPHILVFPNPTMDLFYIKLNNQIQNGIIKLVDNNGKEIYQLDKINGSLIEMKKLGIEAGIYYIYIYEKTKLMARSKIVIQ